MSTDATLLQTAAEEVLDVLRAGAADAGWVPSACVTVQAPSIDCDSIYLWVDGITPLQQGTCQIASRVRFSFFIASCVGASKKEDCKWWEQRAPEHHDRIWAIWVALVEAALAGICSTVTCSETTLNPLLPLSTDGGVGVWQGSVDVVLSPRSGS